MYVYHVMVAANAISLVKSIHRLIYIMLAHSYLCEVWTVSLCNAELF